MKVSLAFARPGKIGSFECWDEWESEGGLT
jgi:hypothetical protein